MTFWSLGALDRMRPCLPDITEWAGVSAGAAMACACSADRARETLEYFCVRVDTNEANIYPGNLFKRQPLFPQEAIYRATILHGLGYGGFENLKSTAPVRILLAHLARGASPLKTIRGAVGAYRGRKKRQILHGPEKPYPGLLEQFVTAQDYSSKRYLCDVILASSCTPPITKVQRLNGRTYADGALIDHAPVRALSSSALSGKVLVFSTNCIPRHALPKIDGRLYFTPSRPIPIAIWDYANADKVKAAFELGREDAEQFLRLLDDFLENER